MQTNKIKLARLLSLVVILWLLAFWWGELGAAFDILLAIPVSVVVAVSIVVLMMWQSRFIGLTYIQRWWHFTGFAVALSGVLFSGFYLGYSQYYRALNGCQAEGEQVRLALQIYYQQHNAYPTSLKNLPLPTLCSRIMHPSLLHYVLTETGYALSYSDWIMHYRATEAGGFDAHK